MSDPKVVEAAAEMAKNLRLGGNVDELLTEERIKAYLASGTRRATSDASDQRSRDSPAELPLVITETRILSTEVEQEPEIPVEFIVGPKKMEPTQSTVHVDADLKIPKKKEYSPANSTDISGDSGIEKIDKINSDERIEPILNQAHGFEIAAVHLASTLNPTAQMEEPAFVQKMDSDSNVNLIAEVDGDLGPNIFPIHEMNFYPTWFRPDGGKSLAEVSDYIYFKEVFLDTKKHFNMTYFVKNIACRPITFRVQSCDETKYEIEPAIGILKEGEMVDITMWTKKSEQWAYNDLQHDSVRILTSAFTTTGDFELENSNEQQFMAMVNFWNKHGTNDFPYAELHYISQVLPFDPSYVDDDGLNKTSFERFHKSFFMLSTIGSNKIKFERKIKDMDLEMLFGDFSQDPGDLFVRDQIRALISNRDRMRKFAYGQKYYLKNLVCFTGGCLCTLAFGWIIKLTGDAKQDGSQVSSGLLNFF